MLNISRNNVSKYVDLFKNTYDLQIIVSDRVQ